VNRTSAPSGGGAAVSIGMPEGPDEAGDGAAATGVGGCVAPAEAGVAGDGAGPQASSVAKGAKVNRRAKGRRRMRARYW